jgi:hypothetical protein
MGWVASGSIPTACAGLVALSLSVCLRVVSALSGTNNAKQNGKKGGTMKAKHSSLLYSVVDVFWAIGASYAAGALST